MEKIFLVYLITQDECDFNVDCTPCKSKEMATATLKKNKCKIICDCLGDVDFEMKDFQEEFYVEENTDNDYEIRSQYRDYLAMTYIEEKELLE